MFGIIFAGVFLSLFRAIWNLFDRAGPSMEFFGEPIFYLLLLIIIRFVAMGYKLLSTFFGAHREWAFQKISCLWRPNYLAYNLSFFVGRGLSSTRTCRRGISVFVTGRAGVEHLELVRKLHGVLHKCFEDLLKIRFR